MARNQGEGSTHAMTTDRRNSALFERDGRHESPQESRDFDIDLAEQDLATVSYYKERGRIRSELVLADWRSSLMAYLLIVLLAFLWS